ncbi:MAG: glyoxalase/bleomycin resistance/extradiol dioxygenase family protein [Bryobacterales bacterium]|nr:glyoxalase/bleomycin resistance/extradiol dioxygenase family protein [Bryobacterales bacterium]
MSHKIFVNLPVVDLERTKTFFKQLGFAFNPKFTDQNAACMILNEGASVMLLAEPFFRGFTDRELCQRTTHTEAILAIDCESRAAVDAFMAKAFAAGAQPAKPPIDHGFMYGSSFYDPDGHHWEVFWMDPNAGPNAAAM